MRAHAVKAESPSAGRRDGLELAADAISPGIIHSQHRGVRGETQPGSRPCLFHHLPLQLQLMRVGGMLQLAAATLAEVGTRSGHTMRRRLDHARGVGHRDAALPATRLGFHHLARERVVDKPDLAIVSGDRRASVRGRSWSEDQRRHTETGSRAALEPAASTICVAIGRPSAVLSGSGAWLPYGTAGPPTARLERISVVS